MKDRLKMAVPAVALLLGSFFLDSAAREIVQIIKSPLLDHVMLWFSNAMTVIGVLVVIAALFLYQEKKGRFIPTLLLSFILSFLISNLLKLVFARERPVGMRHFTFSLFGITASFPDYAFPSVHAATSFSVLPVLDKEFRKLKIFWIFFSVMVVISRIYLYEHYLSDVVAGMILGYFIGLVVLKAEVKYGIEKKFERLFQ